MSLGLPAVQADRSSEMGETRTGLGSRPRYTPPARRSPRSGIEVLLEYCYASSRAMSQSVVVRPSA
jgi:hypothetical protein